VLLLVILDWMTAPGRWWIQGAALGFGVAWFVALVRLITVIAVAGGVAAFVLWLRTRPADDDPTSRLP
jgi:hypothetical protein